MQFANSEEADQLARLHSLIHVFVIRYLDKIIILHGCEVRIENSRPEGHCLASRCFAEWCETVIPRDGIFCPHWTLTFEPFSCIPFDFDCFILKVTFITTHNEIDVGHFKFWRRNDVNLTTNLRDDLYN